MNDPATSEPPVAPPAAPTATLDPETRLMLDVRDDVPGAFEQLVERYQSRVVGILYHMIGEHAEAEDLAQEVFLRVFRSRKAYQPTAKFSTWLFTIVNNRALNAIRDRKRKPSTPQQGSDSGGVGANPLEQLATAPSGATPSREFARNEMALIVRAAVAQLSEDQRMAVILSKFEDMSYRQIGEIMGKSEKAVKSLLSRARVALREILQPYLDQSTGRVAPPDEVDDE